MDQEILYNKSFQIVGRDFANAGSVSVKIKRILKEIGVKPEVVYKVSICCYEAEMNVIMYAKKANLDFTITSDEVIIVLEDEGPGIKNIELAMKEGYSTATPEIREMGFGAGLGLPNIKNNSDEFKIETELLKGTKLYIKIYLN
ncbi:MAG: ATP-binding protein [Ignavibacteriae bacterium]|nr:ATP-binding protein [Ignavibacteriota bacterium]